MICQDQKNEDKFRLTYTDATVRDEVLGRENVGEETDGGGEIDGTDGDELAGGGGRPAEGGGGLEVGGGGGLLPPPPPPPPPPLLAQHAESPAARMHWYGLKSYHSKRCKLTTTELLSWTFHVPNSTAAPNGITNLADCTASRYTINSGTVVPRFH